MIHIKTYLIYAISLVCCSSLLAREDVNPLLGMTGKNGGDYFDRYETFCDSLFSGDSLARVKLLQFFAEAAAADPTGEWDLDRRRLVRRMCGSTRVVREVIRLRKIIPPNSSRKIYSG